MSVQVPIRIALKECAGIVRRGRQTAAEVAPTCSGMALTAARAGMSASRWSSARGATARELVAAVGEMRTVLVSSWSRPMSQTFQRNEYWDNQWDDFSKALAESSLSRRESLRWLGLPNVRIIARTEM